MPTDGPKTIHAFALTATDVGETSSLVTLFTAEFGRISVRARGLRRRGSRDAAVLEAFNIIEARILHREGAEVHTWVDGTVIRPNIEIRTDASRAAAAAIWGEMIGQIECDPLEAPTILSWIEQSLRALASGPHPAGLGILAAWQLIGVLGHRPAFDHCLDTGKPAQEPLLFNLDRGGLVSQREMGSRDHTVAITPDITTILTRVADVSPENLARISLSPSQVKRLTSLLEKYLQVQMDLRLKSLRFFQSLEGTR